MQDADGGAVCLNCGRPGDEMAALGEVTRPRTKVAVRT